MELVVVKLVVVVIFVPNSKARAWVQKEEYLRTGRGH